MRTVRIFAPLLAVAAAAILAAGAGSATTVCSATGLGPAKPQAGLPKPVAAIRVRIVDAARRCDYAALGRIGNEHGTRLQFSFGGGQSAAAYWRQLERSGPRPKPMEALVKVLKLPYVRENGLYNWPSAHRLHPKERDWQALRVLYTPAQIAAMRRSGIGYSGYRAGFRPNGDWLFFVAGD